jgi:hypothetical protein
MIIINVIIIIIIVTVMCLYMNNSYMCIKKLKLKRGILNAAKVECDPIFFN